MKLVVFVRFSGGPHLICESYDNTCIINKKKNPPFPDPAICMGDLNKPLVYIYVYNKLSLIVKSKIYDWCVLCAKIIV